MGDKLTVNLEPRTVHGKKVAKLRADGLVPGVIYGPGVEPVSVQIADNVMDKLYRQAGTYTAVNVTVDGKKMITMIKEVDREPVKGTIRHVSFHAVKATDPITAEVPIRLDGEGESEAERAGLILLQTLEKIEVRALPMDLPDVIHADVRGLHEAGEKMLLDAITLPANVEFVEHESGHLEEDEEHHSVIELVVVSVWEPSALQAANEASGGDAEDESEVESENGEEVPSDEQTDEANKPADGVESK